MGQRRHAPDDRRAWAEVSACGRWRYALGRRWGPGPGMAFVLLNPSTADHLQGDATLARCVARARGLGFGALRVVNLFAWRATDPRVLAQVPDPVGAETDAAIGRAARWAGMVLCGWGVRGGLAGRDRAVRAALGRRRLWHLGLTRGGQPRHPLYVPAARAPEVWA